MKDRAEVGAVTFTLDGAPVSVPPGTTIWEAAHGRGLIIPHLCHHPAPGYRADGNCRACMVEVEGERVLAASCIRAAADGMVVRTDSARARAARRGVLDLLRADQPAREAGPDRSSRFWEVAGDGTEAEAGAGTGAGSGAGSGAEAGGGAPCGGMALPPTLLPPAPDASHPAFRLDLSACIACGLCVRACREVQHNDVLGMAGRGAQAFPAFDFADAVADSTCVACGECVQACPTGALIETAMRGDSGAHDRTERSVCPFCGVGCQVDVRVRDGRIVAVDGADGPANEGRLCVKGRFGFDYVTHPHRLTRPLIRRAGAPKTLDMDPADPLTHFREATWEEALEAAAAGLRGRGRAVAGFGSAKCSNEEAYLFQRLVREGFGHNNVDHCTRLCHASSVAALLEGVGSGAVTAPFNEIAEADVALVIGANPAENHPVAATYFKEFAARGGTLIVMDPRGTALGRHAEHMLRFRPGADVALLNAVMHVIAAEGLEDRAFIEARTEGWDAFAAHLRSFTPEAVEAVTGIAPDALRAAARAFAGADGAADGAGADGARRGMIFWGMGVSQHVHGTDNARCLIALALMTGNLGRPGTGLHPLRGQNNVQGASDAGLIPAFLPDYVRVDDDAGRARAEAAWGATLSPEPGLTVTEIVDAAAQGAVRAMYVMGENPAMSDPDLDHARAALAGLDHLVVQDIFLTETAMLADVVLPASAWFEKTGTVTNTNRQVQMGRAVTPPPGGAREDWRIVQDVARRCGLAWDYAHPRDVYAEMAGLMPSLDHITWDRLEAGAVTYPSTGPDDPGRRVVFADAVPRPGGRARFVPAALRPPAEAPDAAFPMILTTGRQLEHWHTGSMTRRSAVLDAVEPEAHVSLHPGTLEALGVAPGGAVRLTTRRGSVVAAARADRAVARDTAFLPFAYAEAAANRLTNPATDPDAKIPEFKYAAVRVERV